MSKKKFTLEDLKVDDLVTTLTEEEQRDLIGGHPPYPPTKCPVHCPATGIALENSNQNVSST